MKAIKFGAAFTALLLAAGVARAEVIPGRWDRVARLETDTPVIVKLKAGERMHCSFQSLNQEDVDLIDDVGNERRIPRDEILEIESFEKTEDSLKNGAGYGAVFGATGAILSRIHNTKLPAAKIRPRIAGSDKRNCEDCARATTNMQPTMAPTVTENIRLPSMGGGTLTYPIVQAIKPTCPISPHRGIGRHEEFAD
jgi:hypothetical protein